MTKAEARMMFDHAQKARAALQAAHAKLLAEAANRNVRANVEAAIEAVEAILAAANEELS